MATINELSQKMSIKISLADKLKNTDTNVKRNYFIIREHEGKTEILPTTLSDDGNYLTFETNQFSIYALAYEDKKIAIEPNPDTNDKLMRNIIVIAGSITGFCGLYLCLKKRESIKVK